MKITQLLISVYAEGGEGQECYEDAIFDVVWDPPSKSFKVRDYHDKSVALELGAKNAVRAGLFLLADPFLEVAQKLEREGRIRWDPVEKGKV